MRFRTTHFLLMVMVGLALTLPGCSSGSSFAQASGHYVAVGGLGYPQVTTFPIGTAITPMLPVPQGGIPASFRIGAGGLPPGLTLDGADGSIAGLATVAGSYEVTIVAGNDAGTTSETLTLFATTTSTSAFAYPSPQAFPAGAAIPSQTPTPAGSTPGGATGFAVTSGALPPGLGLAGNGVISGTPSSPGLYACTITASHGTGSAAWGLCYQITPAGSFTLNYATPALTLSSNQASSTPPALVSNPGPGTPAFSVSSGALPPGVNLALDGSLTGIPTTPGAYSFVVTATSGNQTATFPESVTVVQSVPAGTLTPSTSSPLFGATVTLTPSFSGGTATIGTGGPGSSDVAASAVSGIPVTSPSITAATTFTLTVTSAAGASAASSCLVTPQTVTVGPVSPANPVRSTGSSTTFSAPVSGGARGTVTWTANAGTIDPATGVWIAPGSANPSVTITATSVDHPTVSATTAVDVVSLGLAASLVPSTATPLYGASVNLTPTFSGGTGMIGSTGAGSFDVTASATSGTAVASGAITAARTFTLTVTNAAGTQSTTSCAVAPQSVSLGAITGAGGPVSVGYPAVESATVAGALNGTITWTANGGSFSPTSTASGANTTWTAPGTAGTYTLTATAQVNGAIQTRDLLVVDLPTVTSFLATPASIASGASSTLSWTTTGATSASIQPTLAGVAVNGSSPVSPTVTTDYSLTATNAAGQTATSDVTVTVIPGPPPVLTSFGLTPITSAPYPTQVLGGLQITAICDSYVLTVPGGSTVPGGALAGTPVQTADFWGVVADPTNTTATELYALCAEGTFTLTLTRNGQQSTSVFSYAPGTALSSGAVSGGLADSGLTDPSLACPW